MEKVYNLKRDEKRNGNEITKDDVRKGKTYVNMRTHVQVVLKNCRPQLVFHSSLLSNFK